MSNKAYLKKCLIKLYSRLGKCNFNAVQPKIMKDKGKCYSQRCRLRQDKCIPVIIIMFSEKNRTFLVKTMTIRFPPIQCQEFVLTAHLPIENNKTSNRKRSPDEQLRVLTQHRKQFSKKKKKETTAEHSTGRNILYTE